jgi:AraC-like DNA-binding protein/mannose-6-phosphate isomerase-like protein (cupin superfamily)
MTIFPKYITDFPKLDNKYPFHLAIHQLAHGYPAHKHDFLEFSFVIDGHGTEVINGIPHPMKPGTFNFLLPYQVHQIYTESTTPLRLFNCNFGQELLLEHLSYTEFYQFLFNIEADLPTFVQLDQKTSQHIQQLLIDMLEEYQQQNRWKRALIGSKLVEALIRFDRARRQLKQPNKKLDTAKLSETIWKVLHYLHVYYRDTLTLSKLAEEFKISPSYLSELFKKEMGQSFVDFLHDLRLRHAIGLLKSTEMSITDISLEVGFGSYQTFVRVFKEKRGMSPSLYRMSAQQSRIKRY